MTMPHGRTSDEGLEDDPVISTLQNAAEVVAAAAALELVVALWARLPEDSWKQLAEAGTRPVLDYPPGYRPAPDDDLCDALGALTGAIGALDGVGVLRLAQFRHHEHGDLTLLEHGPAAAPTVMAVGNSALSAAAARHPMDGFDPAVVALTDSGWSLVYLESRHTHLLDAVRVEAARRRAAAHTAEQGPQNPDPVGWR